MISPSRRSYNKTTCIWCLYMPNVEKIDILNQNLLQIHNCLPSQCWLHAIVCRNEPLARQASFLFGCPCQSVNSYHPNLDPRAPYPQQIQVCPSNFCHVCTFHESLLQLISVNCNSFHFCKQKHLPSRGRRFFPKLLFVCQHTNIVFPFLLLLLLFWLSISWPHPSCCKISQLSFLLYMLLFG